MGKLWRRPLWAQKGAFSFISLKAFAGLTKTVTLRRGFFIDHLFPNQNGVFHHLKVHYGTNVCFHGFLWSSPSTCVPICLRPPCPRTAKWKVSFFLVAPPQAATGYSANSSFRWRTTFRNHRAVWKLPSRPLF